MDGWMDEVRLEERRREERAMFVCRVRRDAEREEGG